MYWPFITAYQLLKQISQKEDQIMGALDDLKAIDQALAADVTALQAAVTSEIARVEAIITQLQTAQASGAVSAADVQSVVTDLQTLKTNLEGATAQLNAERP